MPSTPAPSSTTPTGSASIRRLRSRAGGSGSQRIASTTAATAIGRLTKKIHRQPLCSPSRSRMTPPTTGPTAVEIPIVAPSRPKARPRSAPRKSCWIRPDTCGLRMPPAAPWTSLATTSSALLGARPQARLARPKRTTPTTKTVRRPRTSPMRPEGTRVRPKAKAYPDTTHCRSLGVASRPFWIEGRATLTMLTSSSVMKPATRHTHSAFQRRGSGLSGPLSLGSDGLAAGGSASGVDRSTASSVGCSVRAGSPVTIRGSRWSRRRAAPRRSAPARGRRDRPRQRRPRHARRASSTSAA